jgi:integrase
MLGTGMRVGEITGLRWVDVDMERGFIDINHTLVYYDHGNRHCAYEVNTTKTEASNRVIPILKLARKALLLEKEYQMAAGIRCQKSISGYTDFVFLNRFGDVLNNGVINKAIRRIVRDHNDEEIDKNGDDAFLLPMFSCHSLRHTFTTRMIEAGVNVKVVQDTLGHTDVSTTLNIYADVTDDLKQEEFKQLDEYFDEKVV